MQKDTVLFVLISEFADWEPALLAAGLRWGYGLWDSRYDVKIVSVDEGPVLSIGGLKVVPDYTVATIPKDFAALILIGGTNWFAPEAKAVLPLVRAALDQKAIVGGICDASLFLAVHGFLNEVEHTSSGLGAIKSKAGAAYTGEAKYREQQSVRGGNIVTAKPTGYVEFARDVLSLLGVAPEEKISEFYQLSKKGS